MNLRYIADLHIHSRHAGGCSDKLTIKNISEAAEKKGIGIISTGDFTHPLWLNEIKSSLHEAESGLFTLNKDSSVRFMLGTEVSTVFNEKGGENRGMFSADKSVRKVHTCILAPGIEVIDQINADLGKYGNLSLDGRPMLNMSTPELIECLHSIDPRIFAFPAHIWTPWFGVLGSMSGFDSIKEAYQDQAMHIHAVETGLSSDPAMNWRISGLDDYAIISTSDAHSLPKLAREAITLDIDEKGVSYEAIIKRIKSKRLERTIEFYPEEGKYHYDGHRKCNISLSPEEAKKFNGICPVCRKKLTIGVMHRIGELADREPGFRPKDAVPFIHAIPLQEVIAYVTGKGVSTKTVQEAYTSLLSVFGTELNVLIDADIEAIESIDKNLANAIKNIRSEKVSITPGYDGIFGVIDILGRARSDRKQQAQKSMHDY